MKVVARGPRRAFALAAVLSLTALLLVASGSAAPAPESADTEGLVSPVWTPLGLRNGKTTVVLQLSGDPVALVQAAKGRKLSNAEKQADQGPAEGDAGRPPRRDRQARRHRPGRLPGRLQRPQGADRPQQARRARRSSRRHAVRALQLMKPDNVRGVPLIGAPAVWDGLAGLHGEGIKVAVIDTGIDYTHANFGGPGTTAAYNAANATDTLPANAALFGPAAPRIKGGIDLVGDDYDADADAGRPALSRIRIRTRSTATGTARTSPARPAGSGVLANGTTYTGPYNATTISSNSLDDRPGRRAEGRPLRRPRLRLRRLHRRDRGRDRVGRRERHGRDQHVARLAVRLQGRPVGRRLDERREGRRDRRHVRRQQRPEPVHHRLAGHRARARSPRPRATRRRRSRAPRSRCRDAGDAGDQRQRHPNPHRQRHAEGDPGQPGDAGQTRPRAARSPRSAARCRQHDRGREPWHVRTRRARRSSASRPEQRP